MFKDLVQLEDIKFSNTLPFVLIAGMNVIESNELTLNVANQIKIICNKYNIPFIFKASYDKANRSSINSYRGPGIDKGLEILKTIKDKLNIKIITDVHSPDEAYKASKIVDIIQLPAFLARQTDLISAIAETDCVVNIKKPQFISPYQVNNIVQKFHKLGNNKLLICERGTNFGYDNLVVDMLGFGVIKKTCKNIPIIFDVTHSLQCRNALDTKSSGRRSQVMELTKAGIATGIAGIFLECHPNPEEALCDGPSALPLDLLEIFIKQIKEIDYVIKQQKVIQIR